MKRTNVILDEKLLEEARRLTGEKTYSATITKALEKVVKQQRFREKLAEFDHLAITEGIFHPDYIAEKSATALDGPVKRRLSADVKRAPAKKKKAVRLGSR
jgi:Bacterial antitoxin of type II TA system, VapB